jgi:hypothetical protein
LNFTVATAANEESALFLNNVPIYPWGAVGVSTPLRAKIISGGSPTTAPTEETVPISFQLLVEDITSDPRMIRDGLRLSQMKLTLTRINGAELGHSLPAIDLSVLQLSSELPANGPVVRIVRLSTSPATPSAISPSEQEKQGEAKECSHLPRLCRLKAAAAAKLATLKSHFKGKGCGHHAHKAGVAHNRPHKSWHHQSHHKHGHHKHHGHRASSLLHGLKKVLATCLQIVLPILIGVAAGMTASLAGMIVGTLGVGLYRRFVRGDERGMYEIVGAWDPRPGVEEVLVVDPPAYVDEKVGGTDEVVVVVEEDDAKE